MVWSTSKKMVPLLGNLSNITPMPVDYQYIIVGAIVALAFFGLWKNFSSKDKPGGCDGCPLKNDCEGKSKKNRSNSCTYKK